MKPDHASIHRLLATAPVAVFGAGVSGRGVLELLDRLGARGVLFDEKAPGKAAVNNFTPDQARMYPLVVYSPGFPPGHPWLVRAREAGAVCLGELDFAALFWRGRIIAITGTNGKTTLTEFLTHALRSVGRDAHATGNVGDPFSRLAAAGLADPAGMSGAVAVCEVSSFQAETLEHLRPDALLWTNFAEDHLERHPGMAAYFAAKWRLVTLTAPSAVFVGASVARFAAGSAPGALQEESIVFSEVKSPDPRLAGTVFALQPQRENFLLAAAWWRRTGLSEEDLVAAAKSFRLGRHRLARVAEIDGVTWWNDSKATNFHAVEAAVAGFAAPVLLIAGGKSKGGDLAGFVRRLAPGVRRMFLIGETGLQLALACEAAGIDHVACPGLAAAVHEAAVSARPGEHVLLSPGFASFDQFRNYEDRGNQFEVLVNNLGVSSTLR
jgi:UDP-N-acetylmuramoylalanine--D-glutamate ligase